MEFFTAPFFHSSGFAVFVSGWLSISFILPRCNKKNNNILQKVEKHIDKIIVWALVVTAVFSQNVSSVEAKNIDEDTYQVCRNDIFIDYDELYGYNRRRGNKGKKRWGFLYTSRTAAIPPF